MPARPTFSATAGRRGGAGKRGALREGTVDIDILAERIADCLPPGYASCKAMFGGIAFMRRGNMLCHASRQGLMVRVGADAEPKALAKPYAERCRAGRDMPGFVVVQPEGFVTKRDLAGWLAMARAYVGPMPAKPVKPTTSAKPVKPTMSAKPVRSGARRRAPASRKGVS